MIHAITISPRAGLPESADDTASVAGAVLTHNDIAYDLSTIPDGGEGVPAGVHPFVGKISRSGSTLTYTIVMQFAPETAEDVQTREDWTVTVEDESVPDLVARKPEAPE